MQVLAVGQLSSEGEFQNVSPMLGPRMAMTRNMPVQDDIASILMAGERIPLQIPTAYCEELFENCASEESSHLLRSVYYKHFGEQGDNEHYLLDRQLVNPADLSERTSKILLALRTASLAIWQKDQHRTVKTQIDLEDPATRRRFLQQEHVITLQNRKIQELEARASRIKEVGHSFIENPTTAVELQEAQARLSVLRMYTDQQAADVKKLEADILAAEQQLQDGASAHLVDPLGHDDAPVHDLVFQCLRAYA